MFDHISEHSFICFFCINITNIRLIFVGLRVLLKPYHWMHLVTYGPMLVYLSSCRCQAKFYTPFDLTVFINCSVLRRVDSCCTFWAIISSQLMVLLSTCNRIIVNPRYIYDLCSAYLLFRKQRAMRQTEVFVNCYEANKVFKPNIECVFSWIRMSYANASS